MDEVEADTSDVPDGRWEKHHIDNPVDGTPAKNSLGCTIVAAVSSFAPDTRSFSAFFRWPNSCATRVKRPGYYSVHRCLHLAPRRWTQNAPLEPTTPYDITIQLVMRDRPFPLAVPLETRHHCCFDVPAGLVWKHTTTGTSAFNRGTLFPSAASVPSVAPDSVITGKGSYSLAVLQPSCNVHFDSHTK